MDRDFKINNFDLLRLFAATEVLLLHSFNHLGIKFPLWFTILNFFPGVPMFFTMSGFLISASLERNNSLKIYFKNRALRIYPALWACIILSIVVITLVGKVNFINWQALPWFFSQLVGIIYTPGFLTGFGFKSYNGSLWTIPIELQFYVCLPIGYFIIKKFAKTESKQTLIVLLLFVLFFALTLFLKVKYRLGDIPGLEPRNLKILRYTFIPNIYPFLLGVLLQRYKVYNSAWIYGKAIIWLILYLLVCYVMPQTNTLDMFRFVVLSFTTISIAYTVPTLANKLFKGNDISYGVYIYHGLVLGLIVQLHLLHDPIYILVILVAAVIIASFSWKFIEKPIMRRKKKTIHKLSEADII